MSKLEEIKYRVMASVYPTNHVKHGVRQVAFPYMGIYKSEIFKLFAYKK